MPERRLRTLLELRWNCEAAKDSYEDHRNLLLTLGWERGIAPQTISGKVPSNTAREKTIDKEAVQVPEDWEQRESVSRKEAAAVLRKTTKTIYNYVKAKKLEETNHKDGQWQEFQFTRSRSFSGMRACKLR